MKERLTWEELKRLYDREWVELVDYDWDEREVYPKAGVVRVHSPSREEFDQLTAVNPPIDSAYIFVGKPVPASSFTTRSFSHVQAAKNNA